MVTTYVFAKTKKKGTITAYRIENKNGCVAEFLDYGFTLHGLLVPDAVGLMTDVVLGYPRAVRPTDGGYVGVTVGRVANRIANAAFSIDGKEYKVTANEGAHCLHGGYGFCEKVWEVQADKDGGLVAHCVSEDGEDGFPGRLETTVRIQFTDDNELIYRYSAVSDRKTPVNLTSHAYFNLQGTGNVLKHTLRIDADAISEVDDKLIPTGKALPVAGTPFDFRSPKLVGADIGAHDVQLKRGGGYDHNYVLNGKGFRPVAELSAANGVKMTLKTDAPCVQFYSGQQMAECEGKDRLYGPNSGLCLETQGYPNAVNNPAAPSILLEAGMIYTSKTSYTFSVV